MAAATGAGTSSLRWELRGAGLENIALAQDLGFSQAALAEPWACVEAAYAFQPRTAPLPGGARTRMAGSADPVAAPARARAAHSDGLDDLLLLGSPTPGLAAAAQSLLR